jgi:Flp pilus assembly protein TadD
VYPNLKVITWGIAALAMYPGVQAPRSSTAASRSSLERAYQANNAGVAWLERFDYAKAAASFREALSRQSSLAIARFNLALALLYDGKPKEAEAEVRAAAAAMRGSPGPDYVLGLIAKAQGRGAAAAQAFARAAQADPQDASAQILLGQARLQQGDAAAAVGSLQAALDLEPYSATAAYNLSIALSRSGRTDESRKMLLRFQSLREHGGTTLGAGYLEQGRYARGIVSTGAEPDLIDRAVPNVRFILAPPHPPPLSSPDGSIALLDVDGDGALDIAEAADRGVRLWRTRGKHEPMPAPWARLALSFAPTVIVAGDYNNDGRSDLLVAGAGAVALFRNRGAGAFTNVTAASHLRAVTPDRPLAAAFVDLDHDGDLDVVVAGGVWRNNADGTFADVTVASGISAGHAVAIVPTDYDERRDVDLLIATDTSRLALFRNLRDGTFRDVAREAGLATSGTFTTIAAGDFNRDGRADFLIGRSDGPSVLALSSSSAKYRLEAGPAAATNATAAATIDYDNDGLTDLLIVADGRLHLLRSVGNSWQDVTDRAMLPVNTRRRAFAIADADDDGDDDVFLRTGDSLQMLWNSGGSRNAALRVRLAARVSNRSGTGSRIEMRAGSLHVRRETYAVSPAPAPSDLVLGLGGRTAVDAVRVQWPAGIVQAELQPPLAKPLVVTELDRKPSSCPYLFTWNGTRFQFVTDFLGGGEMGYWLAPGVRNEPDPDEYVRIPADALREKDGRYELRITNELEEVLYLDHLHLEAIAHPAGTDVYPNEGLVSPPYPSHSLFALRNIRPVEAAVDDQGLGLTAAVSAIDRRFADGFALSNIRGYAALHTLTVRFKAEEVRLKADATRADALLLTGWTDYAFSSDNVAASQRGVHMSPPALQIRDADGCWRTVVRDIGIPVGRPQTIVVDLRQPPLRGHREFRIVTNMRIYWDRIAVATVDSGSNVTRGRIDAASAALTWRGFSAELSPDGREPFAYDYDVVSSQSPWKTMPGNYTSEGDVSVPLSAVDDRFVVMRPGDEIALAFDARALPPLPPAWTRTFLLYGNGFSKEMDPNSASPDRVDPIPSHRTEGSARVFRPSRTVITPLPSIDSLLLDALRAPSPVRRPASR